MREFVRLRETWESARIPLAEPAAKGAIEAFERRWKLKLPDEFRQYLSIAAGMQDAQTDDALISFLSLPAIDAEMERSQNTQTVIFAEYCVWSHWYEISCDTAAVYAEDGKNRRKIADGFREFVAVYLEDAQKVAVWWSSADSPSTVS